MKTLEERLDDLRHLVRNRDFLEGKGLSNEVNIRICCYKPEQEMTVVHFVKKLCAEQGADSNIVECNLYKLFIDLCTDLKILDDIPDLEEKEGSDYLLKQLHLAIGTDEFVGKMRRDFDVKTGDVMLITGVGDVFPFMRVHILLEAMQSYFSHVPVVVMYPGTFDGSTVRLFDRLKPNSYYRAFNVV